MSSANPEQQLFSTRESLSSVGRYGLRRVLGTGPTGTIYVAYDPESGREVVVEFMVAGGGHRGRHRQNEILEEARGWEALEHPNFVTIDELGLYNDPIRSDNTGVYVVRELVPGMDLQRWLDALTQPCVMPWTRIVDLFLPIGQVLAAAHERGLVHRAFSPASVIVHYDGSVKLLDFSCRDAQPFNGGTDPCVAPCAYAAPEVQAGVEANAHSDQYSFCAAIWGALLRAKAPKVPKRVAAILARGMQDDPASRWSHMDELLSALDRSRRGLLHRTFTTAFTPAPA